MATSALQKLCNTTIELTEGKHDHLIRESEQLRILKNLIKSDEVILKETVLALIKAMEANNG